VCDARNDLAEHHPGIRVAAVTSVTVSIVLHESADVIESCLRAVDRQTRAPDAVVVFDNASRDDGLAIARRTLPGAGFHRTERNVGFAAGQNQAMRLAPAEIHLTLNPDCQLFPGFIERAVAALEQDRSAGSLSGRLLRFVDGPVDAQPASSEPDDLLDSTGMLALRNRRVLDRGSDEPADGHYVEDQYVFGVSGAAGVYRRAMLEDVAYDGEFFDAAFFAYREDVDLAWRAQQRGWQCRYLPTAVARHRRRVAPGRRGQLPAWINRLSLANRWRMIAKNETALGWRRDWSAILGRDLATVVYCALREPSSLLAVGMVATDATRLRAWRRHIARSRRASPDALLRWFGRVDAEPADRID
jgi:GT2 family glycosyltransferase